MTSELDARFANQLVEEDAVIAAARLHAAELGVEAISAGVGAQCALLVAASGAESIVEVGTGVGVSGLWLLAHSPHATLTSIDAEPEYQRSARRFFTEAGISSSRTRLITGRAHEVLTRMNENSYDVVLVDANPDQVIEYTEYALKLARIGGTVLLPHALWGGKVADPTQRDDITAAYRTLLSETSASPAVACALSPIGDGLLQLTRLA